MEIELRGEFWNLDMLVGVHSSYVFDCIGNTVKPRVGGRERDINPRQESFFFFWKAEWKHVVSYS